MRYLVIDRSTRCPGLAVFEGGGLVFEHVWLGEPSRAPEWMADVERQLADRNIPVASLEGFVCGVGPGSFSGIRAGLAALSGLALPGGKPVYGVASAAALALGHADAERVTVVGDARRNRLWCVTYRVNAGAGRVQLGDGRSPSHTAEDFQLVPSEALATSVPDGTRIVTADWDRLEATLLAAFDESRLVRRSEFPRPAALGALALADPASCVLEPLPIYLHPAVASPGGHAV